MFYWNFFIIRVKIFQNISFFFIPKEVAMKYFERKKQIIEQLKKSNGVSNLNYLCKRLFVSPSTMRRDLINLEEEGIVKRHHGGVSLISNSSTESSIFQRRMENTDKKLAIVKLARTLLRDNLVIFLDSSSTVSLLSPYLKQFNNLTVITNGLNVASQLNSAENIRCFICPGLLKNRSLSIIGEYTYMFLDNFRADLAILSTKSIQADGVFEGDDAQAQCKKYMMKNAKKKILLCDNTKEYAGGYFKLSDFQDFDYIITNDRFSDEIMKKIQETNCNLMINESK